MTSRLAVAVLAAGAGRRLGAIKPLAPLGGQTLLRRAVDTARQIPDADVYVVLGAHAQAIMAAGDAQDIQPIHNPDWEEGMGASLRQATQALGHYPGILFLAVDQPLVTAVDLTEMVTAWRAHPDRPVAAYYAGKPGIPAIFPRCRYPALLRLQGDAGAKSLLRDDRNPPITVPIPGAAHDVDTVESLRDIEAVLRSRGIP